MCPEYDGYDGVHISLWPGIMIKGHLHEWPVRVVSCISVVSHLHHHTPHIINTSWCDMNQGKENSDISKSIRVRLLDEQSLSLLWLHCSVQYIIISRSQCWVWISVDDGLKSVSDLWPQPSSAPWPWWDPRTVTKSYEIIFRITTAPQHYTMMLDKNVKLNTMLIAVTHCWRE